MLGTETTERLWGGESLWYTTQLQERYNTKTRTDMVKISMFIFTCAKRRGTILSVVILLHIESRNCFPAMEEPNYWIYTLSHFMKINNNIETIYKTYSNIWVDQTQFVSFGQIFVLNPSFFSRSHLVIKDVNLLYFLVHYLLTSPSFRLRSNSFFRASASAIRP